MSRSAKFALLPRVGNTLAFIAVIVANGLAGSGALSGESIGVVANRFRSLFLPAGYVFGIWSLIYLWLTVALGYQWSRGEGAAYALRQLGSWWTITAALNIAWVSAFAFSYYATALAVMVALLACLIITSARLRAEPGQGIAFRATVLWAQDLYLAWISVALIANLFQFAHVVQFSGWGLSELQWSLAMMAIATALGWWMAAGLGNWLFPLVVAWAIRGIGVRYPEVAALATAGQDLPWLGILGGLGFYAWATKRRMRSKIS